MAANIDRFKKDLERLTSAGHNLEISIVGKVMGWEKVEETYRNMGKSDAYIDKAKSLIENLSSDYQAWYSESLALIKQVLPDRLDDFKSQYEKPRGRKDDSISFVNYVMSDFMIGLKTTRAGEIVVDGSAGIPKFRVQLAILMAAKTRFESSLFEIRQLVQADLFDSEIGAARELLKNKFLRAAGAIAGVVLEKHLRQVCNDHSVPVTKKNPGIADLNDALKNASVIDIPQWRHVTLMGDYRNLCDHNKQKEPTIEQVTDLIDGTDKILKTIA
ncbi:hypothetical protein [Sphingopyxis sp.]|jgi:hypothetical protein|uniref:hypothetical protein n=1 Tax=Sphingopyxis sp. TaxID=1908224 RepID=UPI003F7266FC